MSLRADFSVLALEYKDINLPAPFALMLKRELWWQEPLR